MAVVRKIVKVFLGSPGDLTAERRTAKSVVDSFNRQWADHLGVHVELIGWEDTVSRFGRAQDLINRDLDQCELFIGMMWKAWGSPPSKDGPYTSGFEEEFDRAVKSRKSLQKPEISLLFKEIDPEFLKDQGEGLKKVLAFKSKVIAEKEILFQSFSDPHDFDDKIRSCITSYVQTLRTEESQRLTEESRPPSVDDSGSAKEKAGNASTALIGPEGAQFLRGFLAKTEGDRSQNPILPVEVARFRLVSSIVAAGGNDDAELGVHDSNIMFAQRTKLKLSRREMEGLIDSALTNFSHQVVPLWHWYKAINADDVGYLSLVSMIGSTNEKIGALNAMRLISEPLSLKPSINNREFEITKAAYLEAWLSSEADDRLKAAALNYLGVCGSIDDLPIIRKEFERGNYQTLGSATEAIIRLNLRDGRGTALDALNDLQPESIDSALIEYLFAKPDSITVVQLLACATHRSLKVRKTAVPILVSRSELPVEIAEKLLEDSDATVRFNALRALSKAGREFNDERAKSVLVKPTGGLGALYGPATDKEGEECFNRFRRERMRSLPDATLEAQVAAQTIFDRDAQFALDYKRFSKRREALRRAVDDEFKTIWAEELAVVEKRWGAENETYKKIKDLADWVRKDFTKQGLDILCQKGGHKDLNVVRAAIERSFVEASNLQVEFLRRFGEWRDVRSLVGLAERRDKASSLLFEPESGKIQIIAKAITALGKGRLPEMLEMEMTDRLRSLIVLQASNADIVNLTEAQVLKLLNSANDQVRRVAAIRSAQAFSKKRVSTILTAYVDHDGHRFYNVIHWLDFGVSLAKARVSPAVARALAKEAA